MLHITNYRSEKSDDMNTHKVRLNIESDEEMEEDEEKEGDQEEMQGAFIILIFLHLFQKLIMKRKLSDIFRLI